jgi:hypothetical protein
MQPETLLSPTQEEIDFTERFRRVVVPENILMSCFEEVDDTGKIVGRVWVSQANEEPAAAEE